MKFKMGDIIRIDDTGYTGLYEVVDEVDASKRYDGFDYDYIVTNNECDSEMYERSKRMILVCSVGNRLDLKEGE